MDQEMLFLAIAASVPLVYLLTPVVQKCWFCGKHKMSWSIYIKRGASRLSFANKAAACKKCCKKHQITTIKGFEQAAKIYRDVKLSVRL
jgi:hypothetical protein